MVRCNARQVENLVVDELKFLGKDPQVIEGVVVRG
jgi:hypothetical protein